MDSNRGLAVGEIANAKAIEDLDVQIIRIEKIRDKEIQGLKAISKSLTINEILHHEQIVRQQIITNLYNQNYMKKGKLQKRD